MVKNLNKNSCIRVLTSSCLLCASPSGIILPIEYSQWDNTAIVPYKAPSKGIFRTPKTDRAIDFPVLYGSVESHHSLFLADSCQKE